MTEGTQAEVGAEVLRMLGAAADAGVPLRAIGGVAVQLRTKGAVPSALTRTSRDIDVVTLKGQGVRVSEFLRDIGYQGNERFNTFNETRLIFFDLLHDRPVDVFVGEFRMCHRIPLHRLELEATTPPLAELLLTKLQVVETNNKDLIDIYALLYAHEIGEVDGETINAGEIARLCGSDWGLWRTTTATLGRVHELLPESGLDTAGRAQIAGRIEQLRQRIEAEPKTMRWKTRARLGDRVRWYEEPEEIEHARVEPRAPADAP
jgi:hypothetical protein